MSEFIRLAQRLVRRLSAWAWHDFLFDVGRVEWRYGRDQNGAAKDWAGWNAVREHLREAGQLRNADELDSPNAQRERPADGGEL